MSKSAHPMPVLSHEQREWLIDSLTRRLDYLQTIGNLASQREVLSHKIALAALTAEAKLHLRSFGEPAQRTYVECGKDYSRGRSYFTVQPVGVINKRSSINGCDLIDWNEISKRGLLVRINREIMHPLGLAIFRNEESGVSEGAVIAPDGIWTYPGDAE